MHPAHIDSKAPPAERATYERLRQALTDEFSVIYDIHFSDPQDSANRQRRIDFLIVHPDWGVLALEVTGGAVRLADNQWHSRDESGKDSIITNPYLQAQNDRAAFSRWLRYDSHASQFAMVYNRHISYAVALPDTDATHANLGLTASPRNTIDYGDLVGLETAVRRVMEHAETNYQIPPQAVSVLVAAVAQAVPQPTAAKAAPPAPPALQAAGRASLGTRVVALVIAIVAVALLALFLIFSHNQSGTPAVIAKVSATSTPTTAVEPDTPAATATTAAAAADTPLNTVPSISTPTSALQLAIGSDALVTQDGNLRVHKQPATAADVVVELLPGAKVHITGGPTQAEGHTWWQVVGWPNSNGSTGWCAGEFLQPVANQSAAIVPTVAPTLDVASPTALPAAGNTPTPQLAVGSDALATQDGNLRVRAQPSANATIVVELAPGRRVHIIGGPQQADGHTWWQVGGWPDANGSTGWCAGEFLQPVSPLVQAY